MKMIFLYLWLLMMWLMENIHVYVFLLQYTR